MMIPFTTLNPLFPSGGVFLKRKNHVLLLWGISSGQVAAGPSPYLHEQERSFSQMLSVELWTVTL